MLKQTDINGRREHTPSAVETPSAVSSSSHHSGILQITGEINTTISPHTSHMNKEPKKRRPLKARIASEVVNSPSDVDDQKRPVLFISINTGLNESIVRTVVPGTTDKATFQCRYNAYQSIPSRWPRLKRATGIKFFRVCTRQVYLLVGRTLSCWSMQLTMA